MSSTELDEVPVLDEAPPVWPPIAHIVRKEEPLREGMLALCGERLMGLPLPDARTICEQCIRIARRMSGA